MSFTGATRQATGQVWWRRHFVRAQEAQAMDMKLKVVVVPVTDVDRAKDFYTAGLPS